MRYFYEPSSRSIPIYGALFHCDHPAFDNCTLFKMADKGFCVIQQRYSEKTKSTTWGPIDSVLANDIYLHKKFVEVFFNIAGPLKNGYYPTYTIRQIMWKLRMKPLKKELWETVFDHAPITIPFTKGV